MSAVPFHSPYAQVIAGNECSSQSEIAQHGKASTEWRKIVPLILPS